MSSNWRTQVERQLTQAWLRRGLLSIALLPVAATYSVLTAFQRWLFQIGLHKSTRLPATVIVVGNVVAGGAGKTPTVIAIAKQLASDGLHVGVISRGYGRKSTDIQEVLSHSTAAEVGDEPLLMQRHLNMPMFVGSDRVATALRLLHKYPQVNTVLCDDGIQHLPLFRDMEIYVFDNRGVGNGFALPSGPLRSPWPPVYVAQTGQSAEKSMVLHTGSHPAFAGHRAKRFLAPWGLRSDGTTIALNELQRNSQRLIAIAGIAQPSAFFEMLTDAGIQTAQNIAYPDHYDFTDWASPTKTGYTLICTEKDAVKIWPIDPSVIAIPLVQTLDQAFFDDIRSALRRPTPPPTRYH